jgi:hypothetical protein
VPIADDLWTTLASPDSSIRSQPEWKPEWKVTRSVRVRLADGHGPQLHFHAVAVVGIGPAVATSRCDGATM